MRKIASTFLTLTALVAISSCCFAKTRYTYVTPKAPVITESLKPCIAKYKEGNYTGAMFDLEELTKKEKNNVYAKYYLALTYTQLGYTDKAKKAYGEVVSANTNASLTHYSKKAVACLDDPKSEICNPSFAPAKKEEPVTEKEKEEIDDMTKFIYSGKKIHPAAMDLIIRERMEVKLQEEEFRRKQAEQLPISANPTNEEIASALNTLAKIGINPFGQNYMLSSNSFEFGNMNNYNAMPYIYRNANSDIGQMLLYSQLGQQKNNFINYGI